MLELDKSSKPVDSYDLAEKPWLIVCHTRDRPAVLKLTLASFAPLIYGIADKQFLGLVLIDDSQHPENQQENRVVLQQFPQIPTAYFGGSEQEVLLQLLETPKAEIWNYIRRLGEPSWDPGAARNTASLLYSAMGYKQLIILSIDDDIAFIPLVENPLDRVIQSLQQGSNRVFGAIYSGGDDMTLFMKSISAIQEKGNNRPPPKTIPLTPLSGCFMAFESQWAKLYPFPRCYNEDWIWAMCLKKSAVEFETAPIVIFDRHEPGLQYNPLAIQRQTFGEVLCKGFGRFLESYKDSPEDCLELQSKGFWEQTLNDEIEEIEQLLETIKFNSQSKKSAASKIIQHTHSMLNSLEVSKLQTFMTEFLANIYPWRKISFSLRFDVF